MNLYALADRLHMTLDEVEQISMTEYHGWLAYFKLLKEQSEHDTNATKNQSPRPNKNSL